MSQGHNHQASFEAYTGRTEKQTKCLIFTKSSFEKDLLAESRLKAEEIQLLSLKIVNLKTKWRYKNAMANHKI